MSTYINVTVGKTGLSDKAKQQTNANRQAKLEADARNKAEVDGKRQRDANRALQGIGPDGKPLFGQPLQTAVRKDEPAAFRYQAQTKVSHIWADTKYALPYSPTDGLSCGLLGIPYPRSKGVTPSFGEATESTTLRCGDGAKSLATPSIGFDWINYPTEGYAWNPTLNEYYDSTYGWVPYGYGFRTFRYASQLEKQTTPLVLPCGRGTSVIFLFRSAIRHFIDIRVMHYWIGPGTGSPYDSPHTQEQLRIIAEAYGLFEPGAEHALGRPYIVSNGVTLGYVDGYPSDPGATASASVYGDSIEIQNEVYFCSHLGIKKITPSSKLQQFIDYVNPNDTTQKETFHLESTNQWVNLDVSIPKLTTRVSSISGLQKTALFYDEDSKAEITVDPQIFESLNEFYSFISAESIKPSSSARYRLRSDTTEGAYVEPAENLYSSELPFFYAQNSASAPASEIGKRIPAATLLMNTSRPTLEEFISLYRAWDWDEPGYCRQMCLALGFTEADLTP